jgi:hypothetical protein
MSQSNNDTFAADGAEAARVVREVQDLGFDAARTIVDRFAALFTQFAAGAGPAGAGPTGTAAPGDGRGLPWTFGLWGSDQPGQGMQADMQRAANSYLAILAQMNEAGLRLLDATRWWQQAPPAASSGSSGSTASTASTGSTGPAGPAGPGDPTVLRLPEVAPGGRVSAHLWLHNTTPASATGLKPWCPGLTSHSGVALPSSAITCTPARVDRLDSGASADILVTAAVGDDAPAGTFHGLILADGLPDVVFPLCLRVRPATSGS